MIRGHRKIPLSHVGPAELDRQLGFPRLQAVREAETCLILWSFPGGTPDHFPPTWTWSVERSNSPGGPFYEAATDLPSSATQWRDDELPRGRENTRRIYYRVKFDTGEVTTYGYRPEWDRNVPGDDLHGFTWGPAGVRPAHSPGIARTAQQRFDIYVRRRGRHFAGLYRADWMSGACPQCVDPVTGTHLSINDCAACLGTQFARGFCTPLRAEFVFHGRAAAVPQHTQTGPNDLVEAETIIWPYWPIPQDHDILRFSDGRLFEVTGVKPEVYLDYPVVYVSTATQLPRGHILNSLPMPEMLSDAAMGPRRQHGRAKNLVAFHDSLTEGGMARAGRSLPDLNEEDPDL